MSYNAPPPGYGSNPYGQAPPGGYPPPPPPQREEPPSQTMAIVALVLCCIVFIPLAVIVGIGLAIAVLVKSTPERNFGTGKAITGIAIGVCGLIIMFGLFALITSMRTGTNVDRDQDGSVTSSGTVLTTALRVGDCFNSKTEVPESEVVVVGTVELIPCAESHDWEAFHGFELEDGSWPGDTEVARLAEGGCVEAFSGFTGQSYDESTLEVYFFLPVAESWAEGDRKVLCNVGTGTPITGSLEGSP